MDGGKSPPDFAMLIGKRLSDKKKDGYGGSDEGIGPPMAGDEEDGGKEQAEDSAITEFMAAKDPKAAKAALKDFLEICYPSLSEEGGESEDEEAAEQEEAPDEAAE